MVPDFYFYFLKNKIVVEMWGKKTNKTMRPWWKEGKFILPAAGSEEGCGAEGLRQDSGV